MKTTAEPIDPDFFTGFQRLDIDAGGVKFAGVIGGEGPPLLLLHGYPQNHIAWRRVAPELAKHYRVIVPDLPGYGASQSIDNHSRWTKRRGADALVKLMQHLGHEQFALAGHDRGARVAYRLALDHPDKVTALVSLAVIPTLDAMNAIDYLAAGRAFHWFLLAQPADLPERLLAADPDAFIDQALTQMTGGRDFIEPRALDAYRAAFRNPDVRRAMCEDYRSAMNEDLAYDTADREKGRRIACPVLVLWPQRQAGPDLPAAIGIWHRWADQVEGRATTGGHLQLEEAPMEVLDALWPFFNTHALSHTPAR